MAGLSTGAGAPSVKVYHEKSMILPDVSRVLVCLYEKNVEFETVKDSYKDILRLQASRSVPVPFYDGPTFLQETRAICRYIAETYEQRGYPFLLGKDVLERASIEQWLRHEEHNFDPPSRALFCHLAFPLPDDNDDDINKEKRKLEEVLEVYEQRLSESEFLAGNKFTLADLVHLPNTHHILTSEKFAYLYDSRKNVHKWWDRISARDSWQQVLMDMKYVQEQYEKEELEQQQEQWQTEPLPTSGVHNNHIDHLKKPGAKSQTILVPPPSVGVISTSFSSVPQEEQPLPSEAASSHSKPLPTKEKNFFTTTEKSPSTQGSRTPITQKSTTSAFFTTNMPSTAPRTPQRTDTDKSSSQDASYPTKPSETPSKEAPDKAHLAGFFKASSHTDEAATPTKPSPPEASKTSNKIPETREASEAVAPHKPGEQNIPKKFIAPQTLKVPDLSTMQADSKEDTHVMREDDRFSTKRPSKMFEESEAAEAIKSQPTDFQPSKEEETPYFSKRPSDVQDRPALDDGKTGSSPSTGTQAADSPTSAAERRVASPSQPTNFQPSKEEETPYFSKRPSDVQDRPVLDDGKTGSSPSTGTRAAGSPTSAAERRVASPSQPTNFQPSKEEGTPYFSKRSSDVQDRPVLDDGKTGSSPSTGTRATDSPTSADKKDTPAILKKTTVQGAISDVRGISDDDRAMKLASDQKEAQDAPKQKPVSSSQQKNEPVKGITPTSYGITGEDLAKTSIADERPKPSSKVQAPASNGKSASTALKGGVPDAHGKNIADKPSATDPTSTLTTPRRQEPTPETQHRRTADQVPDQAPVPSSFASTRNEENGISEVGQSNTKAPDEQPGRGIPKDAGAPDVGPSVMKPEKNMNEAYNDGAPIEQLPSDQYRSQSEENKKKQGADAALDNEINKPKKDGFLANANQTSTGKVQATSTEEKSKQQMQPGVNKLISSKDSNEIVSYQNSATASEMLPSVPDRSMKAQQVLDGKSSMSPQDNVKQGSEYALQEYGTEQPKKPELLAKADEKIGITLGDAIQKPEEQTSPDTEKMKSNRNSSKSDGSTRPSPFDGNEGDLPESQRRGSSSNP